MKRQIHRFTEKQKQMDESGHGQVIWNQPPSSVLKNVLVFILVCILHSHPAEIVLKCIIKASVSEEVSSFFFK